MARLNIITPNTNVSPTLAQFPTGASNGDILVWNSTTSKIEWVTSPHITKYTDTEAVDAWEAATTITSTTNNKDFHYTLSSERGVTGYQWWGGDELWIGNPKGIIIENNEICGWGAPTINAGSFVVDTKYRILVAGNTDFTAIGAADNDVDTVFIATGVGSGTGTAKEVVQLVLGGTHSSTGIIVDEEITFNNTNHGSASAIFNLPVEMNSTLQVDGTSVFNNTVEFNNPIQVDSTSVFNNTVELNNPLQVDGTSVFNNTVEFNNPIQVDSTSVFNDAVKMEKATVGMLSPVLHLEHGETGWNKAHMLLEDTNDDVVSIVGRDDQSSGAENYQYNFTLDPNNTQPRTNVGGTGETYAGDYFVAFRKLYHDTDEIEMDMQVFGAHNGFTISARDDANGSTFSGGPYPDRHYKYKPIKLKGEALSVWAGEDEPEQVLSCVSNRVAVKKPFQLHSATSDPSGENGDMYYKSDTHQIRAYVNGAWGTLDFTAD